MTEQDQTESALVRIAFVGDDTAGKCALLNAILRQDILSAEDFQSEGPAVVFLQGKTSISFLDAHGETKSLEFYDETQSDAARCLVFAHPSELLGDFSVLVANGSSVDAIGLDDGAGGTDVLVCISKDTAPFLSWHQQANTHPERMILVATDGSASAPDGVTLLETGPVAGASEVQQVLVEIAGAADECWHGLAQRPERRGGGYLDLFQHSYRAPESAEFVATEEQESELRAELYEMWQNTLTRYDESDADELKAAADEFATDLDQQYFSKS